MNYMATTDQKPTNKNYKQRNIDITLKYFSSRKERLKEKEDNKRTIETNFLNGIKYIPINIHFKYQCTNCSDQKT